MREGSLSNQRALGNSVQSKESVSKIEEVHQYNRSISARYLLMLSCMRQVEKFAESKLVFVMILFVAARIIL